MAKESSRMKFLCAIFGHDDTDAVWEARKAFETKIYCQRCGWRTRVGDPSIVRLKEQVRSKRVRDELKSCLLMAGLASLIGLALWRWIYVIKRLDLQF